MSNEDAMKDELSAEAAARVVESLASSYASKERGSDHRVGYMDALKDAADELRHGGNHHARRSPDTPVTVGEDEAADALWVELLPHMQVGDADAYSKKVKALAIIRAALSARTSTAPVAFPSDEERRRRAAGPATVSWPMPDPLAKYRPASPPGVTVTEELRKAATLLEILAEDAQVRGDTASWSMASVMAKNARAALSFTTRDTAAAGQPLDDHLLAGTTENDPADHPFLRAAGEPDER